MIKMYPVLLLWLLLKSFGLQAQNGLPYEYLHSFMSDAKNMKANNIVEIVANVSDVDYLDKSITKEVIHYVFDESGRLILEYRGKQFPFGVINEGDYAIKFAYASNMTKPSAITYYLNDGEFKSYNATYSYDQNNRLIEYKCDLNAVNVSYLYSAGNLVREEVDSEEEHFVSIKEFKYPAALLTEVYEYTVDPNDVSDDPQPRFLLSEKIHKNTVGQVTKVESSLMIGANNLDVLIYKNGVLTKCTSKLADGSTSYTKSNVLSSDNLVTSTKESFFEFYSTNIEREITTNFEYKHR